MQIIDENRVYWDNDMECWCFESEEDFEKAIPVALHDKYIKRETYKEIYGFCKTQQYSKESFEEWLQQKIKELE